MYLEEGRDYRRHDERDMSGLRLAKSYEKTIVYSVEVGSPAEKAGLKAGDVIIKVGRKLASEYDIWILRRDLMEMDGNKVEITFERKGQRKGTPLVLAQKL
jgi:C-terminal processing protease CtpA/Prc